MYPMEPPEPKQIDRAHLLYIINYDLCRGEDQTGMNPSPEIPKNIKRTDCLTTLSYWGWKRSLWVVPQHSSIEHCQLQTFPFVQVMQNIIGKFGKNITYMPVGSCKDEERLRCS